MRYSIEALFRSKMANEQFEFPDLYWLQGKVSYLKNFVEENKNNYLLELYYLCLQLSLKTNKKNLMLYTNAIFEKASSIQEYELGFIISFANNYTSYISRMPNCEDLIETNYKLYKLGLKKSIFLTNGLLLPQIIINYAYLCSELNKPDEIIEYWEEYNFKIDKKFKNSTYYLCLAYNAFAKKEFKKAIDLTNKESKREMRFFISKKLLQIKSYYELNNYLVVEEERNNLMKYLNNNKGAFNEFIYDAFYNFTQIIREMSKPDCSKETLLNIINKQNFLTVDRHWIVNKITKK